MRLLWGREPPQLRGSPTVASLSGAPRKIFLMSPFLGFSVLVWPIALKTRINKSRAQKSYDVICKLRGSTVMTFVMVPASSHDAA